MQSNLAESHVLEERAAAIAHEVKNPLTMVGLNLDILEASDKRLGADRNYAMIRKELRKISDLMMDFIYLSSSGQNDMEEVTISSLLNEIRNDLSISMPNIFVKIAHPNDSLVLHANENSLRKLFNNIIKNATEAMEYSGEIRINTLVQDDYITIQVRDSGPGICPSVRERLFKEPFTTKPLGSGLGLSICKKIAEEHSGHFTLDNSENGGCVATVTLKRFPSRMC